MTLLSSKPSIARMVLLGTSLGNGFLTNSMTCSVILGLPMVFAGCFFFLNAPNVFKARCPKAWALKPIRIIPVRANLMVLGSLAFKNIMEACVTRLLFLKPRSFSNLRIRTLTSPKSILTGQGVKHLWQMVQWSATSFISSKCRMEMPRLVCSSYKNTSILKPVARILLRGEYSRLARGICVVQTGLHFPQRRQSLISLLSLPSSSFSSTMVSRSTRRSEGV